MSSPDSSRPRGRETRVFLENLPKDVRKDEIDKEFSAYGRIAKVYLIYDPPGSGFVEFFKSDDAKLAAEAMDGMEFLGSKLKTQLTRGGVPRGRGTPRGGRFSNFSGGGGYRSREDGYSGGGGYRSRDDGYSRGGRGGFRSRGFRSRGRGNGGSYGSRGFGNWRGGEDRGFKGYSSGGGFSRGKSYSRGGEGSRSFSSRYGDDYASSKYESYDDGDASPNGYDKYGDYEKSYGKYESFSKYGGYDKSYDKPSYGHSRYSSDKYSSFSEMPRKDYERSRSPIGYSDEYRSSSGNYMRNSSSYGSRRSPMDERY